MDDLTRMVLRYLQWPQSGLNERPTYWAMAKGLGVSPRAVKARLDLLVPRGVVKKFRIVIEPSCLGLKESIISVQCTNTFQDKLASKISLFDFIETVHLV
ncbi:MAG: hypothetical protein JRN68_11255, partial [Nitrososphaerota archaeon]|nr:hypothetical protein [Nitrososphaerota archaeon]